MENVKTFPSRISNKINYKIILLCIAGSLIFQYSVALSFIEDKEKIGTYLIEIAFVVSPLFAGLFAFIIAGFYSLSRIFGRSYIVLGIGYLASVTAELLFSIQNDIMNIDPYPSIADPFYALLNICIITYVMINTNFFEKKSLSNDGKFHKHITNRTLSIFISIFSAVIFSYILISLSNPLFQFNFEFFYGLIFVILSGITLSFLVHGVLLFQNSILGKAWDLLLFAFIILVIGDVWYYHLEILGDYHIYHPVNIFWLSSYWIQAYALYKHKKAT